MAALDIAGTIVGAATATSGLILVFLGATTSAYESYHAQERKTVRGRYQRRANFAFGSLIVCLASTLFGLLAEWFEADGLAVAAFGLLCLSLLGVVTTAYIAISEIK